MPKSPLNPVLEADTYMPFAHPPDLQPGLAGALRDVAPVQRNVP